MAASTPDTTSSFDAIWDAAQGGASDAQLALGRHYAADEDFGRARRWLGRAARNGEAAGFTELAMLEMQGLGMAADPAGARLHLESAVAAGDPQAHHELALLEYRSGRRSWEEAVDGLTIAARCGHGPAQTQLGMLALATAPELGRELLAMGAQQQELLAVVALTTLAELDGHATEAAALARHARALGSYCVDRFGPREESNARLPVPRMEAADIPRLPTRKQSEATATLPLGDDRVRVYDAMLSTVECRYLIEITAPHLRPSHTVHPQTGEAVRNEMRTSYGYSLHPVQEDFAVLAIKARLAAQTGFPVAHAEPFALLRYENGQQYQAHFDYIDPASGEAGRELARFGQREVTIFSYLTSPETGGETAFPRHDLQVRAREGRALMFRNTLPDGTPDPDSLHASLPVTEGEKWIATLWIRGRSLQP